jgi:hypothetical protein
MKETVKVRRYGVSSPGHTTVGQPPIHPTRHNIQPQIIVRVVAAAVAADGVGAFDGLGVDDPGGGLLVAALLGTDAAA